jgi:hypothetical protein
MRAIVNVVPEFSCFRRHPNFGSGTAQCTLFAVSAHLLVTAHQRPSLILSRHMIFSLWFFPLYSLNISGKFCIKKYETVFLTKINA